MRTLECDKEAVSCSFTGFFLFAEKLFLRCFCNVCTFCVDVAVDRKPLFLSLSCKLTRFHTFFQFAVLLRSVEKRKFQSEAKLGAARAVADTHDGWKERVNGYRSESREFIFFFSGFV